jgi:hypothetical protein
MAVMRWMLGLALDDCMAVMRWMLGLELADEVPEPDGVDPAAEADWHVMDGDEVPRIKKADGPTQSRIDGDNSWHYRQ